MRHGDSSEEEFNMGSGGVGYKEGLQHKFLGQISRIELFFQIVTLPGPLNKYRNIRNYLHYAYKKLIS